MSELGIIARHAPEPLAQLIIGALNEAALSIAHQPDAKAGADKTKVSRQFKARRRSPEAISATCRRTAAEALMPSAPRPRSASAKAVPKKAAISSTPSGSRRKRWLRLNRAGTT